MNPIDSPTLITIIQGLLVIVTGFVAYWCKSMAADIKETQNEASKFRTEVQSDASKLRTRIETLSAHSEGRDALQNERWAGLKANLEGLSHTMERTQRDVQTLVHHNLIKPESK